jgi:hypothetical protein
LEKKIGTVILALLVLSVAAAGQQKDPRVNPPVQPLPPLPAGESSTSTGTGAEPATPADPQEKRPASEIEQLELGLGSGGRSLLTSGFRVTFHGDSNANASAGTSRINSGGTFTGNVSLIRNWGRSALTVSYNGGGTIYNTRNARYRQGQVLGLGYSLAGRSWRLSFQDRVSFLPESSFGYGQGATGVLLPGAPGGVQAQLNPLLVPNQSILSGYGRRISNTSAAQVAYTLNRRSSLFVSGSYGFLRGVGSNLIGNDRWSVGLGYNYQFSGVDALSVSYSHSSSSFSNTSFGYSGDTMSLGYSRQLSGRLALQVSGGPSINRFRNQVAGNRTRVSGSIRSSLHYQLVDSRLDLTYTRGITGGSGVLLGAHTDQIEGGISKQLSRMWGASLRLGYAHNESLVQSTGLTNQFTFNGWHSNVSFSRPLGRYTQLGLSYGVTGQKSNTSFCLGSVCGRSTIRHRFGLSFTFGLPPIALD